jgi:hypothetical protein
VYFAANAWNASRAAAITASACFEADEVGALDAQDPSARARVLDFSVEPKHQGVKRGEYAQ